MTERKEDIRRLLDRYMAGDTSLEEEARLQLVKQEGIHV